ncbi:MAG: hypothetical protein J6A21_08235 [Lentisphaeria bacterium]|nr:hypothetical protein [Lentisphaeria bacterium]
MPERNKSVFPVYRPEQEEDPGHECTSWMIFPDLTGNGTTVLHKNRDSKDRGVAVLLSSEKSPRKWIGLGHKSEERQLPCMGMNSSGVAAAMNSGMTCVDNSTNPQGKTTPEQLAVMLEESDTAARALEVLLELVKAEDYEHGNKGSTFFIADAHEGYVCEYTAHFHSVQRVDSSYILRANIWHNPGIAALTEDPFIPFLNSCGREYIGVNFLNHALREKGRLDRQDCLDLARFCRMPEDSPLFHRSICHKFTNSSATFVIDPEFPDVLSCGFFTAGHPRHTICVPVPVCVEALHPKMADLPALSWSSEAWKRLDVRGFDAPIPEEFLSFEKDAFSEFEQAQKGAKALLKEGKKQEAVQLVNASAARIWEGAAALMGI